MFWHFGPKQILKGTSRIILLCWTALLAFKESNTGRFKNFITITNYGWVFSQWLFWQWPSKEKKTLLFTFLLVYNIAFCHGGSE